MLTAAHWSFFLELSSAVQAERLVADSLELAYVCVRRELMFFAVLIVISRGEREPYCT